MYCFHTGISFAVSYVQDRSVRASRAAYTVAGGRQMAAKKNVLRKKYTNYVSVQVSREHAEINRKWAKRKKLWRDPLKATKGENET